MLLVYLGIAILAYLIGAIPVGAIVAGTKRIDLWKQGSGKLGTTNVLRTMGKRAAAAVLVGDFAKGAVAVWAARLIADALLTPEALVSWLGDRVSVLTLAGAVAAAAAIGGHVWSIYMRLLTGNWRGGRGVATAMGAMLAVNPWITVIALVVGLPTVAISRYVSLGSILGTTAGAIAVVLFVLLGWEPVLSLLFLALAVFIVASHHDNISRLLKGTERKLGDRAKV